ncbi:transglycosylase SLT domain-containing protein [Tabrizicola sp. J26]|uniref:transglycosylase SLT domain-containing protein n=1 Tax=Alitabrizicola rongguiensis TaxID=2909234 RepID=UPI001F428FA0|nr:transglycosylase SLT domain-containing protein [Tabrizicola rongguiensis]MCF1707240.1 transglycosylase SLT domain-containing protein [Tabrizicola rongguiensis]
MAFKLTRAVLLGAILALPMGCADKTTSTLPPMRWDHRPEATVWTKTALAAIDEDAANLPALVPGDINTWCPGYTHATEAEREAFWTGVFSALAKHESTWNPAASGGGGRWIGLLQISPQTARQYGCDAKSTAALKDGSENLACAIKIASVQVQRDGMVAGNGAQGLGRDWAPFRNASKRADMAAWTRAQEYCQPKKRVMAAL